MRSALRVRLSSQDFIQESVIFLNHGALKSSLAPAQGITFVPAYRGREMLVPVLFDEFNHIFDGHRNLLTDVDVTAAIEVRHAQESNSRPSYSMNLRHKYYRS
jgi:hypothetical protein